jgi:hypothetical protein
MKYANIVHMIPLLRLRSQSSKYPISVGYQGSKLTTQLCLMQRLRMCGACTILQSTLEGHFTYNYLTFM